MNDLERIFWEEVESLPEHKRTFDEDIVNVIFNAMGRYTTQRVEEEVGSKIDFTNERISEFEPLLKRAINADKGIYLIRVLQEIKELSIRKYIDASCALES